MRAIRAGADGYLSKERPGEEVVEGVARILDGGQYISAELAALLIGSVEGGKAGRHRALSDREMQVLRRLASGKTPTEIGAELALSDRTIGTYRARVLEKLKLRTNADLVRYAIEHGIVE